MIGDHDTIYPQSWERTTLGFIREDDSQSIDPRKFPNESYELYSVPSFEDRIPEISRGKIIGSSKRTVIEDTILLCKINPRINRVWVVGSHSNHRKIASTEWIPFFPVKGILPKYLCYYMRQDKFRNFLFANVSGVGGSLMRVKPSTLEDYGFPVAPFNEQIRIVYEIEKQFTRLDAGVEALKKIKAQLKRYRQAVLKYAFEGKLTEEWRRTYKGKAESASVLLKRIKEERRKKAEEKYKELPSVDTSDLPALPEGWLWTRLGETAEINPKFHEEGVTDDIEVTFLPMKCVEELTGHIDLSFTRRLSEVKKGYTPFIDGDLLFAKITPCMENGKVAIAHSLKNGIGFGSTEFHIIRLPESLPRKFFFFFLIRETLRKDAQRNMTGSAGQLRVPVNYIQRIPIPLPHLPEQHKVFEEIERRFSVADEVEKVVDQSLKQAERLRQSILKKAFEGKLVPQDPSDEPASVLLERIKEEKGKKETFTKGSGKIEIRR